MRSKLTALQNDAELAPRARVEIREAEQAVETAERPLDKLDTALGAHRVYMADRQVEIARAKAATRLAEDSRARLSEERSDARLAARTREADRAHADATLARSSEADMRRRLEELKAKPTERGIVITLGDVLFDSGSATLRSGADDNLSKLVSFLTQYPDRRVLIEGHTDNVGSEAANRKLSQQRAESVRQRLVNEGIESGRMSVLGKGMNNPVANNNTDAGRQQNRRVEIIIEDQEGDTSRNLRDPYSRQ
ncbi:MAG: OmpA family protein [Alcanivoracaceae bacterium]